MLALDNPVGLKTRLGRGYTLAVNNSQPYSKQRKDLLDKLRRDSPNIRSESAKGKDLYLTGSTDLGVVRKLVEQMQSERQAGNNLQYQINGATLEEVFLDLNSESTTPEIHFRDGDRESSGSGVNEPDANGNGWEKGVDGTRDVEDGGLGLRPVTPVSSKTNPPLTPGRKRGFLLSIPINAFIIFRKRLLNVRRAWLLPLIAVIVVISGTCIPLFFMKDRNQTCAFITRRATTQVLTWPQSPYPFAYPPLVIAPESQGVFGNVFSSPFLSGLVQTESDNASFVELFRTDYRNQDFGGVSIAPDPTTASLFAWEGSNLLNKGLSSLNLISNAVLNQLSPPEGNPLRITLGYRPLPSPSFLSTATAMRWIGFLCVFILWTVSVTAGSR